ncbi:hypothetical protein Har1130_14445 [Haloarcula sp. CBA1130]|uniref:hypothetical protein n=1 Tax=unclassified Haloarcula TaxID=2624677 RepID=UPI0012458928|nr:MULTISPECIES: hypothetical protein [unclassified Haloarcula]KAA9399374.1 hypothetical protein Har1129_14545 [Haloarcula sp. CBA1129]KAA9403889.1 hypothetical protein Har1130_14445 [Haloarcula sp. CBA1130]
MGLFDTIRRAVGGDDSSTDGDERTAGGDPPSDDGPDLLDTSTLDQTTFREYAERVVDGADPLTFDPAALVRLDTAIEESYGGETVGDAAGVTTYTANTVRFGSYLGELLVRAYDGEWVQSDGRWGVTVAGPDDEVAVAVFDVAARSFGDESVFAAVVTRLESELALDTARATDDDERAGPDAGDPAADSVVSEPTRVVGRVDDGQADERDVPPEPTATGEPDAGGATDTTASDPSRAIETEPTRVVRRVEAESEDDDRSDDADPTPVVSETADKPETEARSDDDDADSPVSDIGGDANTERTDSASDDAGSEPPAAATAGDESTVGSRDGESTTETTAEQSAADIADAQPPLETPTEEPTFDASENGPDVDTTDAADTVTADEVSAYIDEAEPASDSATAPPSDEAPAAETPPAESAVDASAVAAADTTAAEAATDTADDGAAERSLDDESSSENSPDASSDTAPDVTAAPETDSGEPPTDTADEEGTNETTGTPGPSLTDDVEATDTSERAASQDVPADETATDESEPAVPSDGDSTASTVARPWESGTVRAEHADTAVEFADFWGEHDLDFAPASLSRLDDLVDAEWDDERFAETTFESDASFDDRAFTSVVRELGGYFGEVLVRHLDGDWTDETNHEAAVVVGGPDGQFAVPVFEVAMTSLRKQAVFGRSYDALLEDLGRDGPAR